MPEFESRSGTEKTFYQFYSMLFLLFLLYYHWLLIVLHLLFFLSAGNLEATLRTRYSSVVAANDALNGNSEEWTEIVPKSVPKPKDNKLIQTDPELEFRKENQELKVHEHKIVQTDGGHLDSVTDVDSCCTDYTNPARSLTECLTVYKTKVGYLFHMYK